MPRRVSAGLSGKITLVQSLPNIGLFGEKITSAKNTRVIRNMKIKIRWLSDSKKLLDDILGQGGCGAAGNYATALHSIIIAGLANKMQMLLN